MFSYIWDKLYYHGPSNMLSFPFPLMLAKFFAPSRDTTCASTHPWNQFCHESPPYLPMDWVRSFKKLLYKYVWSFSVEKISFIRSCDVEEIKATDCIIKVHITSGNIKWRSFALRFCASNHKSTWQPLLPSTKGLSFIIIFYLMQVSWWCSPWLKY